MAKRDSVLRSVGLRATAGKRTLRFGLVSVGIGMAPALDTSARISGNYVEDGTGTKLKQVYVNPDTDEIVPREMIATAFPTEHGYVQLRDSEMPAMQSTDVIDLVACLSEYEVPSEWILDTKLTWPTDTTQDAGYMLVANYLRAGKRAFIGTTVANKTTKAFVLRWSEEYGCIVAQLLAYHAQVREANVAEVRRGVASIAQPDPAMASMANTIFDSLDADFEWDEVRDEYGIALEAAITEKAATGQVTGDPVATPTTAPADLMAALQASIEAKGAEREKVAAL